MEKLWQFLERYEWFQRFSAWTKRVSLPGFEGVPLFYVGRFFLEEMRNDRLSIRAAAVAFYFVLAIFPGILFLFSLIPYIPVVGFQETLFNTLQQVLPHSGFEFMQSAITDIISRTRFELLSIGFVMTFYFSTNGVNALVRSFTKSQPIFEKRNFWQRKWAVVKLTVLLFVLLLLSVFLIIMGNVIISELAWRLGVVNQFQVFLLSFTRWVVIVALFFSAISLIYYIAPAANWNIISAGSTLATIMSILISLGFTFVVNKFNLYNEIYGSIGALIGILLWIYFNSLIILIGFELNVSIKYQHVVRLEKNEKKSVEQESE